MSKQYVVEIREDWLSNGEWIALRFPTKRGALEFLREARSEGFRVRGIKEIEKVLESRRDES